MGSVLDDGERLHPEAIEEWRAWLGVNHGRANGVWLVSWKKVTARPAVLYVEVVEEALCVGWVDSTARTIDGERSMVWFAPRKKASVWAATNKERVERLEAEGRMTDAGRRLVAQARADGSWTLLEPAERLEVPGDLAAALDERPGSRDTWDGFPPSVRKAALTSLLLAQRAETRARRIAAIADKAARGERPA